MVVRRANENCEFRLYLPHANVVEVVGDFTRWQERPLAMQRESDGWWSVFVTVPGGSHRFSYLVDGRYWMPDYAANGIEHNAQGQWVSRLDVEALEDAPTPPREARWVAGAPGRDAAPVVQVNVKALGPCLGASSVMGIAGAVAGAGR